MKKVTTRIRFIDSKSKEFISKKLKDSCEKVIDEYNNNPSTPSPMLKVGKYENGDWDTQFKEGMSQFKKVSLLEYTDKDGLLDFDKLFKEFYAFLSSKNVDDKEVTLNDDEELEDDEEVEEVTEEEAEEVLEEVDEEDEDEDITYEEYLRQELETLEKKDFRYYLIKIILKESKGWGYLKSPSNLAGDEYDVVTPKNAKKIQKSFSETSK